MSFSLVSNCLVYTQLVTLVSSSLWIGGHFHLNRYLGLFLEVIAFLLGTPHLYVYLHPVFYMIFPYTFAFILCLPYFLLSLIDHLYYYAILFELTICQL